jgi:hypothetical protein
MWQIVYYNFMPDYLDKYAAYVLEKERAAGATAAQLEAQRQEMAQFKDVRQSANERGVHYPRTAAGGCLDFAD